jgi:hypothetical protein
MKWFRNKVKLPKIGSRKYPNLPAVFIPSPVENYPGFESTPSAFYHAEILVSKAIESLENSDWAVKGKNIYTTFHNIQGLKLPKTEFEFLSRKLPILWDKFRGYLMQPTVYGKWSVQEYGDINKILESEYQQFSKEYGRADKVWNSAADLTMISLDMALERDQQILAQPIIEYVLIIWLSYCRSLER